MRKINEYISSGLFLAAPISLFVTSNIQCAFYLLLCAIYMEIRILTSRN